MSYMGAGGGVIFGINYCTIMRGPVVRGSVRFIVLYCTSTVVQALGFIGNLGMYGEDVLYQPLQSEWDKVL